MNISKGRKVSSPVQVFSSLPDSARIWIYCAQRPLTDRESQALTDHVGRFLADWTSHTRAVAPSWQLLYSQFVIVGVDETSVSLSGCSIDSLVRTLNEFSQVLRVSFSSSGNQVVFRDAAGVVQCVDRLTFRELAMQDAVNPDTIVFNNVVPTVGEFRAGRWEVAMRESWHMEAFGHLLSERGSRVHNASLNGE